MKKESEIIKKGGVGIIPTDTLYGIVASALNSKAVERVYTVKGRRTDKSCIVLISSLKTLDSFGIFLSNNVRAFLLKVWPGKVTVILSCVRDAFSYLHRGTRTIAFRLPKDERLISFLKETGPLIAPSANPEGKNPATTIEEAKKYFGNSIDFYMDGGKKSSLSSTIVKVGENGQYTVVRQGDEQI
ncbi:MAG: threonylcarbamoyl-AMP synthase [Candidatus Pacebacteria bacterium]|nr:threonylcarbamoyl-AMP synthase [Candidatus Paceibacterota bacterium]